MTKKSLADLVRRLNPPQFPAPESCVRLNAELQLIWTCARCKDSLLTVPNFHVQFRDDRWQHVPEHFTGKVLCTECLDLYAWLATVRKRFLDMLAKLEARRGK